MGMQSKLQLQATRWSLGGGLLGGLGGTAEEVAERGQLELAGGLERDGEVADDGEVDGELDEELVVDVPVPAQVLHERDEEVVWHLGGHLQLGHLAAVLDPARVRDGAARHLLAAALEGEGDVADGDAVGVGVGDVDVAVHGDGLAGHALEAHLVQRRLRLGHVRDLVRHEPLGLVQQARHASSRLFL